MKVWVLWTHVAYDTDDCNIIKVFTNKDSAMAECKLVMVDLMKYYVRYNMSLEDLENLINPTSSAHPFVDTWSCDNEFGICYTGACGILQVCITKRELCN